MIKDKIFIQQNQHKFMFYFDIETVSQYKTLEDLRKNDERGYELFVRKFERKQNNENWKGDINSIYTEQTPLIPEFGKIICFSGGFYKLSSDEIIVNTYFDTDEKALLLKIKALFDKLTTTLIAEKINDREIGIGEVDIRKICGYNIKKFDIPWIVKRMLIHDIDVNVEIGTPESPYKYKSILNTIGKKPWELDTIEDLADVWKYNSTEFSSLEELAWCLNIDSFKKIILNGNLHEHYWDKPNHDLIKTYCSNDVKVLPEVVKKIYGNLVL